MNLLNSQYDRIMSGFDARRRENKYLLDKRTKEIYNKCPEILSIDNEIARESADRAKRSLMGETDALVGIEEFIDGLSRKKAELLLKLGYPADYLQPIYDCPLCHDTGYIEREQCSCFKKAANRVRFESSNISSLTDTQNFDTFNLELFSREASSMGISPYDNMKMILEKSHAFVDNFDTQHGNILIKGTAGVGKTFLSSCIAKALLDSSHSVLYYSASGLFKLLDDIHFGNGSDESAHDDDYILKCDLLIIDDLGTEFYNRFTVSSLFTIINERGLCNKSTIISTNLSLKQFEDQYSERILSRINQYYQFFSLFGADLREP